MDSEVWAKIRLEAERFVAETGSSWDHAQWSAFLGSIRSRYGAVDETRLGLMLGECRRQGPSAHPRPDASDATELRSEGKPEMGTAAVMDGLPKEQRAGAGDAVPDFAQWRYPLYVVVASIAALFAAVCLIVVPVWYADDAGLKAALLSIWTIGVLLWFFVDYHYLIPLAARAKPESDFMNRYKAGKELGEKVWLAIAAVLLGLYFGDIFKSRDSTAVDELRNEVTALKRQVQELQRGKGQ
jgi:hypothetical protein